MEMQIVFIRILIIIIITFRIQNFLVARLGSSLVNFSLCRQILKKVKIELAPGTKKYFMRPIRNRNWQSAPGWYIKTVKGQKISPKQRKIKIDSNKQQRG
jgi:hypothetical protein